MTHSTHDPMQRAMQLLVQTERDVSRAIEIANGLPLTSQEADILGVS